jgi:hypothetical protein
MQNILCVSQALSLLPGQVFIMDKVKAAELGGNEPFNRIRRALGAELAALGPDERVLLLGLSAAPFACKRKDEEALLALFTKQIHVPLPDYASRQVGGIRHCWEGPGCWAACMLLHASTSYKMQEYQHPVTPA